MLLYEYEVRDRLDRLAEYAQNVLAKFVANAPAGELLLDARSLKQLHELLIEALPQDAKNASNLGRHVHWMIYHLERDSVNSCRGDIEDICRYDIREVENAFRKWCKNQNHYDAELVQGVSALVLRQEYDSAVRKAFVILKSRFVSVFNARSNLDGIDLVNNIFGRSGCGQISDDAERQAFRDLLAGLYGVFRNKYAHNDAIPLWAESDAIISMVNFVLQELGRLTSQSL